MGRDNDIYNHYVVHSTCTYQEAPEPIESRWAWFERRGQEHSVTVAERDGLVIGWGALSPFHARSAYRFTVENSVYVDHRCHRQGIGDALLRDLIGRARLAGIGRSSQGSTPASAPAWPSTRSMASRPSAT